MHARWVSNIPHSIPKVKKVIQKNRNSRIRKLQKPQIGSVAIVTARNRFSYTTSFEPTSMLFFIRFLHFFVVYFFKIRTLAHDSTVERHRLIWVYLCGLSVFNPWSFLRKHWTVRNAAMCEWQDTPNWCRQSMDKSSESSIELLATIFTPKL